MSAMPTVKEQRCLETLLTSANPSQMSDSTLRLEGVYINTHTPFLTTLMTKNKSDGN